MKIEGDNMDRNSNNTEILWITLKKVCEITCGMPVNIMLTTELDQNLNSATIFNGNEATILLNASYCKSENMIFKCVAHEAAHILEGNSVEGNSWKEREQALYGRIEDEYVMAMERLRKGRI